MKLKFPNKFDNSNEKYQLQSLGELQSLRGQSFISSNDKPELILKELSNAKANNEFDYFSSILDYIIMNIPRPEQQLELTEEKRNFYKSAEQLSKDFKAVV